MDKKQLILDKISKYGVAPPIEIARKEGLEIWERPLPERVGDMIFKGVIIIPRGLKEIAREFRVSHCLGHHWLHSHNEVWMSCSEMVIKRTEEGEACVTSLFLMLNWLNPAEKEKYFNTFTMDMNPWVWIAAMSTIDSEIAPLRNDLEKISVNNALKRSLVLINK